jgi:transposase-like protein
LAIPKLRYGSYFPDWLLERRKRAEQALTTVVATCYLLGVSLSLRVAYEREETLGIRYAPTGGGHTSRAVFGNLHSTGVKTAAD